VWPATGLPVADGAGDQNLLALASDGAGGAFVVWQDGPSATRRLQRIANDGTIGTGWPAGGIVLSSTQFLSATADGAGGVIAFFLTATEPATNGTQRRFLAWRYAHDGSLAPGWPAAGLLVYNDFKSAFDSNPFPSLSDVSSFADGLGGAHLTMRFENFVVSGWHHMRALAAGAPGAYFNADAIPFGPRIVRPLSDGAGGVDELHHRIADGLRAVKYSSAGVQTHQRVLTGSTDDLDIRLLRLTPGGDLLALWASISFNQINTLRLTPTLTNAAGWGGASTDARFLPLASDGSGDVFARVLGGGGNSIQRVSYSTSVPAPQWILPQLPMYKDGPIVADGAGGFFLVWAGPGVGLNTSLGATHHLANGDPGLGWLPTGRELSPSIAGTPLLVQGSPGSGLAAWTDRRSGDRDIFLQRLADDAVVPVAASLARAEAHADRVELEWAVTDAPAELSVERSVASSAWSRLGDATLASHERWAFEDRDVRSGDAIAYRLVGRDGVVPGSEAFVRIPTAAVLALRGFVTNPSQGDATVEFSLPDAESATLELLDVSGRTLDRRAVGALGAGQHRVRLAADRVLSPGLYFVRLQRAGESRVTRASAIR